MKTSLMLTIDYPPLSGGVANYNASLNAQLPQKNITVLTTPHPEAKTFDSKQKYSIIRRKLLRRRLFTPGWLPMLKQAKIELKKGHFDLIQAAQVLPCGIVALLLKRRFKIPYLVYTHGLDILLPQSHPRHFKQLKRVLGEATSVVANSEFTKKELLKLNVEENKITIINPCPFITPEFPNQKSNSFLKKRSLAPRTKILLTVGRLVERKGHDKVIAALPEVLKQIPDLVYLIVGKGPHEKSLKTQVAALNLEKHVLFAGFVPDMELPSLYRASDIFVMPARQIKKDVEGFGLVYLEANSFWKPVIAGKSGGVGDAVVDNLNGLLVNPTSEEEISKAIIKLFNNPDLMNKLGVQGKKRVEEEFQWGKQAEKLKNLLK